MIIKSQANPKFKLIKKLRNKKYRDKEGLFVIESRKLIEEAIKSHVDIDFLFLREGISFEENIPYLVFDDNCFNKLSELKSPDGFAAVIRKNKAEDLSSDRVLLLDHISDPGNMGTIIRSAEAFGFSDIILTKGCVDIYNEKCLRASMGSVFRVNIIELNLEEISKLKKNYRFLSSHMEGIDVRKYDSSNDSIILAIGNEANGLSEDIRKLTDDFIKISMQGEIESLNAAIAASIMMNTLGY